MGLDTIVKKYMLPVILGGAFVLGACTPGYVESDKDVRATIEAGGSGILSSQISLIVGDSDSLASKLDSNRESGNYVVISVDYPLMFTDQSSRGYNFRLTRIIARESGQSDIDSYDTFLYLGDRPVITGAEVQLEYFPVKEGEIITVADISTFLNLYDYPYTNNRPIDGLQGPYSITGIIAIDNDSFGIDYASPGE